MKILLNVLTALLLTSQVAYAQSYIGGRKVTEAEVLTFRGIPSTKVSRSNQAVIYQSSVDGKLKCSEDGGAFTDCVGGSSASGDKITEGNTEAEVVDTGSDGHFKVTTEGTERLRVTETGNVGIGTSTPVYELDIQGYNGRAWVQTLGGNIIAERYGDGDSGPNFDGFKARGTKGALTIAQDNDIALNIAGKLYDGDAFERAAQIVFSADGAVGNNDTPGRITFLTTPDGSKTLSERMRITNAGNVGIGTTAPTSKLHLNGTLGSLSGGLAFGDGDTGFYEAADDVLRIQTAGSDRMTVLADGNVGIGTTEPVHKLDVSGEIKTNSNFILSSTTGTGSDVSFYNTRPFANLAVMTVYPSSISANVNSTLAVVPKGAGVANNLAQITVAGTDNVADSINYEFAGIRNAGSITILGTGKSGTGQNRPILISSGYLSDSITNNNQLYLATSGNVGIGTTAPSAKLHAISTTEQLRLGYDKSNYVSTTVGSTGIVTHDAVGSGSSFVFSDPVIVTPTAAQTIAAGNTITANACGSIKEITAAGAVTTDTTNTFTAPAAANDGCCMDVVNIGAENITLDNNANFVSAGAADVVLGAGDTLRVCSTGASGKWYQIGSTGNNCGDEAGGDRVEKITTYVGNAQLDTAQSKFGGSSLLLDGNSDYVTISDSDDWNFGTGNFTWEAWVYFNSFNATYNTIINQGESDGLPEIHFFYHQDSPGPGLFFWVYDNSSELFRIYTSGALSTSTWYHLAVVRSGTGTGDTNLYINGIKQSVSTSGAWNYNIVDVSEPLTIGRRTTYYTSGYFDEIRISKGIARWTADFTPPTAEYLPDQYTKLLLHFGGSDNSSATATEDSSEGENK